MPKLSKSIVLIALTACSISLPLAAEADFNFGDLLGYKRCKLPPEIIDTGRSDEEIRAEADGQIKRGKKCDAAITLMEIQNRYPMVKLVEKEGSPVVEVTVAEPEFYEEVYLQIAELLLDSESYGIAAEMLKAFSRRFPLSKNNETAIYLLSETYYRRIPKDYRLDSTATEKAQQQYANLIKTYPQTARKEEITKKTRFCYQWMARHELEAALRLFRNEDYYGSIQQLNLIVQRYNRFDDMAQVLYYRCRGLLLLGKTNLSTDPNNVNSKNGEVSDKLWKEAMTKNSEGVLQDLRKYFAETEWREKGEKYCGLKGDESPSSDERWSLFRGRRK